MKKQTKCSADLVFIIGICLLVVAGAVLISWQWGIRASQQRAEDVVHRLRTLVPEPQSAVPEEKRDNAMSVLSIDGTDFIGILEMPQYSSALPVCADWGESSKYPSRLGGSVYDRTIQIGGTAQKGQYDFYRQISVGDSVFFTDMAGNHYAYAVADIRYEKHADQTTLQGENAALTLFIKNVYAFDYIVIFCDVLG